MDKVVEIRGGVTNEIGGYHAHEIDDARKRETVPKDEVRDLSITEGRKLVANGFGRTVSGVHNVTIAVIDITYLVLVDEDTICPTVISQEVEGVLNVLELSNNTAIIDVPCVEVEFRGSRGNILDERVEDKAEQKRGKRATLLGALAREDRLGATTDE